MSRSFRMKALSVGTAVVALGFGLSACSPPNEQPSDLKTDNATSFAAPATQSSSEKSGESTAKPIFHTCGNTPVTEPGDLYLACGDGSDRMVNITWDSWTNEGATGTGTRETQERPSGKIERTENVSIEMQTPPLPPMALLSSKSRLAMMRSFRHLSPCANLF